MIKAVFFDWFNTLACFEPSREEVHRQAFGEFGIPLSPREIMRGLVVADRGWYEEKSKSKMKERSPKERAEMGIRYEETILAEAGVKAPRETLVKIIKKVQQLYKGMTFILFDDVLSTLQVLKEQDFTLGVLTNVARDMDSICCQLGLELYLDFIVTSGEVGVDKPQPPIFLAALERAGVDAVNAVHVGDQYKIDIIGARGVGITPILIDRYGLYADITDCPRIQRLPEVVNYLQC